jgi:hypothetical protein
MMRFLTCCGLWLSLVVAPSISQGTHRHRGSDDSQAILWSATIGLGGGMLSFDKGAVAADVALSLAQSDRKYTLRFAEISEFEICIFGCPTLESLTEVSGLYGLMNKKRYGYVSASAGLGVVYHVNQNDDGSIGPGFPAMAEAFVLDAVQVPRSGHHGERQRESVQYKLDVDVRHSGGSVISVTSSAGPADYSHACMKQAA